MRKIFTMQLEVNLDDEVYDEFDNHQLVDVFNDSATTFAEFNEYFAHSLSSVIAVNDTVESEKPDGDSTGETNGPVGLYEVPC
jgi:hypothetical protein